jgi:hypothetical protein
VYSSVSDLRADLDAVMRTQGAAAGNT